MSNNGQTSSHRVLGWLLTAAGVIGVVTGMVPLVVATSLVLAGKTPGADMGIFAHGMAELGLSSEWVMLSSAMGTCLGVMLLVAGAGWLRGRAWAAPVTWMYVLAGFAVNATDTTIFAVLAQPGAVRIRMLVADGVALAIPLCLAAWLVSRRR